MQSYQISLTRHERAAGRFISSVRRALQRALAEERTTRGVTQAAIAEELGVNRSVINRQIMGKEDISLGRVGAIASVLGRSITFSLDLVPQQPVSNTYTFGQKIDVSLNADEPRSDTVWPRIPRHDPRAMIAG